jgi:hypothetical protein
VSIPGITSPEALRKREEERRIAEWRAAGVVVSGEVAA